MWACSRLKTCRQYFFELSLIRSAVHGGLFIVHEKNCAMHTHSAIACWDLFSSVNADLLLTAGNVLKLDLSADESEQSVIRSATDIVAGMDLGASLANNDVAGEDCLTVCLLHAESLGLAVASVLSRTDTFFMSEIL